MLTGRFAPSPSGRMHLGNVFSALLAWLSVRSRNGRMLLRIEDLDPDRCRPEYIEALKRDLDWLGLDWDEEQAPQSMRSDAYHVEFEKLRTLGLVYPCYCSRAELHAASAPHASDGNVIYAGTCRNLTETERAAKTRKPAWRVIVPDTVITSKDGLQGEYAENLARDCGDFIICRSDGVYAYQLAVVTDDAAGGVTEVVRGRDLLSSVPRQMWLQKILGFPTPAYYHVPLLLAPDGKRLSKRENRWISERCGSAARRSSWSERLRSLQAFSPNLRLLHLPRWYLDLRGKTSNPTMSLFIPNSDVIYHKWYKLIRNMECIGIFLSIFLFTTEWKMWYTECVGLSERTRNY